MFLAIKIPETSTDWLAGNWHLSACRSACLAISPLNCLSNWRGNRPNPSCPLPWTNIYLAAPQSFWYYVLSPQAQYLPWDQVTNQCNPVYSLLMYSTLSYYTISLCYLSSYILLDFTSCTEAWERDCKSKRLSVSPILVLCSKC
jgi:hypothetical protein